MRTTPTYAPEMIRITTYITREQDTALNSLAETTGKTKSELIRSSITEFTSDPVPDPSDEDVNNFIADLQQGFSACHRMPFDEFAAMCFDDAIDYRGDTSTIRKYQTALAERMDTYGRMIICSPSQCGLTQLFIMYAAYRASIKQTKIVFGVMKERIATDITNKIELLFKHTPKISVLTKTKNTIKLSNGSTIAVLSVASDTFSTELNDISTEFIIDEFAYANPHSVMDGLTYKMMTQCKQPQFRILIGSTPAGAIRYDAGIPTLTHFYRLWAFALATDSPLRALQITKDAVESFRSNRFDDIFDRSTHAGECRYTSESEGTFYTTSNDMFIDVIGGDND